MYLNYGRKYKIQFYVLANGKAPVLDWLESLDRLAKIRIQNYLIRIREGNLGDHKFLGDDLYEIRLFYGPGYRIYFSIEGTEIILLLKAGDKSTQKKDIDLARKYLLDYRGRDE